MNLHLADPLDHQHHFPQLLLADLDVQGQSVVFSRDGEMFAVGGHLRVTIMSFDTKGVLKHMIFPFDSVKVLSFSAFGDYLACLGDGETLFAVFLADAKIAWQRNIKGFLSCSVSPTNAWCSIVSRIDCSSIVNMKSGESRDIFVKEGGRSTMSSDGMSGIAVYSDGLVEVWELSGILKRHNLKPFGSVKCIKASLVPGLYTVLCKRSIHLLQVTKDANLTYRGEFKEAINRTQFSSCALSGHGESLAAMALHSDGGKLHLWDVHTRQLVDILKEPSNRIFIDIAWHPVLPVVISAADNGSISIWRKSIEQKWTGFAPHFHALDQNVVYDEPEDEFDDNDKQTVLGFAKPSENRIRSIDIRLLQPHSSAQSFKLALDL